MWWENSVKATADIAAQLSAVILAGGKSSRFGTDKTRMELSGRRVLDHLLAVFRDFPFRQLVIVTAKGKEEDRPEGASILSDDQEGLGPIGGITTALRHLRTGILIAACDMPFISRSVIAWLLDQYDADVDAIIPKHAQGIEPLFAIYRTSALATLEAEIQSGRYALHLALDHVRARFVDVPAEFSFEREFSNINTPEDYADAVKLIKGNR